MHDDASTHDAPPGPLSSRSMLRLYTDIHTVPSSVNALCRGIHVTGTLPMAHETKSARFSPHNRRHTRAQITSSDATPNQTPPQHTNRLTNLNTRLPTVADISLQARRARSSTRLMGRAYVDAHRCDACIRECMSACVRRAFAYQYVACGVHTGMHNGTRRANVNADRHARTGSRGGRGGALAGSCMLRSRRTLQA